jgi:protein SCO1
VNFGNDRFLIKIKDVVVRSGYFLRCKMGVMMIRRQILLAAAALLVVLGAGFGQSATTAADDAGGEPWQLKPFMLEDVAGAVVDDTALKGKFALVFFGYTSCPDICPTTLLTIGQALKGLGPEADRVLPLFVSLDPDRDSRKVLSDFTAAIDPHIVGLRGPKAFVDAMTQNFGVTYQIVTPNPAKPKDYSIDHTATIFFIGPDGTMLHRFSHLISAQELQQKIHASLAAAPAQ